MNDDFLGVCIGCAAIYSAAWAFAWSCETIGFWLTLGIVVLALQCLTFLAQRDYLKA